LGTDGRREKDGFSGGWGLKRIIKKDRRGSKKRGKRRGSKYGIMSIAVKRFERGRTLNQSLD